MKCPYCGTCYDGPFRFCSRCGSPLVYDKKGSHRVPLLILLGLSLLGLALFFIFPRESAALPKSDMPWFDVSDGALYFEELIYEGEPEVEVPAVIDGQTVSSIDVYGFAYSVEITTVILPDTVTSIGDYAFTDCYSLRAIDLPDSVTSIGEYAFCNCPELEALHIPESVETIGQGSFDGCEDLSFIFFDGTAEEWKALYPWSIESRPMICTSDGNNFRSE